MRLRRGLVGGCFQFSDQGRFGGVNPGELPTQGCGAVLIALGLFGGAGRNVGSLEGVRGGVGLAWASASHRVMAGARVATGRGMAPRGGWPRWWSWCGG
jgi:hypothetical protein